MPVADSGAGGLRPRFSGLAQSADKSRPQRGQGLLLERSVASDPNLSFGLAPASALGPAMRAFGCTSVSKEGSPPRSGLPANFVIPQVSTNWAPPAPNRFYTPPNTRPAGDGLRPKFLTPQPKNRDVVDRQQLHLARRDSKSAGLGLGSQDGEGDDLRSKTAPDGERLPDVVRNVSEAVHHEDKVKSMYAAPAQRNPAVHRRSMDMSRAMAQERASGGADADRRSNVDGRSKNFGHMEPRSTLGAEEHEHQQPAQREAHRSLPGYRDSADPGSRGSTSSGETGIQRRASMLGEGRGRLRPLPQGGAEHRSSTASGEIPRQVSVGSRRRSLDRPSDPPRMNGTSSGELSTKNMAAKRQQHLVKSRSNVSAQAPRTARLGQTTIGLGNRRRSQMSEDTPLGGVPDEAEEEREKAFEGAEATSGRKQMLSFEEAQARALERADGEGSAVEANPCREPDPEEPEHNSQWGIAAVDLRRKLSTDPELEQADINKEDLTYRLECACDSGYLNITYNQWPEMPELVGNFMHSKAGVLLALNYEGNQTRVFPDVCGNMTRLVSLNLGANSLEALPSSLSSLVSLASLSLEKNKLRTLPDTLGECSNLTYLDISHNKLMWLPDTLSNLKSLLTLKVTHNRLCHLPEQICDMASLKEINASHNIITGIPLQIAKLPQLELLRLNYNKLTAIPETIGGLWRSLVELELDHNDISILPHSLSACKKLDALELGSNPMVLPPPNVVQEGTARVMEYLSSSNGLVAQDPRYGWMRAKDDGQAKRQVMADVVARLTRSLERAKSRNKSAQPDMADQTEDSKPECGVCIKLMVEMKQRDEEISAVLERLHEKEAQVEEVQRDCNEYRSNMLRKQNRLREVKDKLHELIVERDRETRRANELEAELGALNDRVSDKHNADAGRETSLAQQQQQQQQQKLRDLESANAALMAKNGELEKSSASAQAAAEQQAAKLQAKLDGMRVTAAAAETALERERSAAKAREEELLAEIERLKQAAAVLIPAGGDHAMPGGAGTPTHTLLMSGEMLFGNASGGKSKGR